jgi:hypothetical protein
VIERERLVLVAGCCTPSLASTAWCRPSDQRRPGMSAAGELVDDDDLAVLRTT